MNEPRDAAPNTAADAGLKRGTSAYRRGTIALLAAALASFNAMYCTQALMPVLTEDLLITPAQAALTISATTGVLAFSILPASILSERFGRGRVIITSALAATLIGLLLPFAPGLEWLVAGRALQGLTLAGVPATAMAWLAQEVRGRDLPHAMGLYVAGNTIGGLLGRLIPAGVLQFADWRVALGVSMCFAFACAVLIAVILPKERRFTPKKLRLGNEVSTMVRQWADPRLASLFLVALIFMGAFVSLYNFLGFRLTDTFGLPDSLAGAIFVLYLFGTVASARSGHAVVARGRGKTMLLGAALVIISLPPMLINNLWVTLIGVGLFTYGFFTVHSVASGWVGALAPLSRGEASGMYLTCYYLGSSVVGYASGHVLHTFGWAGMTAWIGLIVALGCALVGYLAFRESRTGTASHRATAALLETGETPGE
ncbi:MAG: MFS transporter [Ancrocorticia sp.]|uniref:MFS transporter n=1 Tax=Ancrocorticia sp. TaxID=2593684 RepID=UPI003F929692